MARSEALIGRTSRSPAGQRDDSLVRAGLSANLLLGFAPFIAFALLMRLSVSLALWTAFATAFTLGLPAFLKTRVVKTLDAGSVVLFGLLALFAGFVPPLATQGAARLMVDAGLLAVVLVSLSLREPFTLQYAREVVAPERAHSAEFVRLHRWISVAWAAGFAAMTTADAAAVFVAGMPETAAAVLGLAALLGALTFTLRFPAYAGRRSP